MNVRGNAAAAVALGLVAALGGGCGEDEPDLTVEIISPIEGSQVSVPFEVSINTSVPIGPPSDDLHHVHLWFGEDQDAYQVVETNLVRITTAPTGEQEVHASLRNPDHTRAGVETSIRVVIVE